MGPSCNISEDKHEVREMLSKECNTFAWDDSDVRCIETMKIDKLTDKTPVYNAIP